MNKFYDTVKKATKGVVDTGAKQMLKADVLFLDREIKTRKQVFGIEIYDLMEELENYDSTTMSPTDKETKIRAVFDGARKDIAVIQAKKDCKVEEMAVLDAEAGTTTSSTKPSSTTTTDVPMTTATDGP